MKVLILTNDNYDTWMWYRIQEHLRQHDIHIYHESDPYPFEQIKSYDVGISFMYLHKVPASQLTHTWINFHPAPLPEYKGRDLCYHAIMNGEKEFGATIHYMDENFDTGDIIEVRKFSISDSWTAEELSEEALVYSMQLFVEYLPKILETPVFPRTPNIGGTYYKKGGIVDEMPLFDGPISRWIRAVTYKDFHPTITIGGIKYKIVREK